MKKLVNKKMIAAAMMVAATLMNPVNSYSNVKIDTLKNVDTEKTAISPDAEEVLEEATLEIENWMSEEIYTAKEEVLNVEDWMSEEIYTAEEEVLNVEDWMSEEIYSAEEETLQIEDWMSDPNYFNK